MVWISGWDVRAGLGNAVANNNFGRTTGQDKPATVGEAAVINVG